MVLTALESAHRTKLVRIANAVYAVLVVIVWVLARTSSILLLPQAGQGLHRLSGYLSLVSFFRSC
jgi:hypothetical protein